MYPELVVAEHPEGCGAQDQSSKLPRTLREQDFGVTLLVRHMQLSGVPREIASELPAN